MTFRYARKSQCRVRQRVAPGEKMKTSADSKPSFSSICATIDAILVGNAMGSCKRQGCFWTDRMANGAIRICRRE